MLKFFICLFSFLSFHCLLAQDGSPNSAFGNSGLVEIDISEDEEIQSLIELDNGNLLAMGNFSFENTNTQFLLQYNEAGDLVTSYGDNGVLQLNEDFNDSQDLLFAQPGQKIVLSAYSNDLFQIKRITINAQLDTSFGTNGILVPIPESDNLGQVLYLEDASFFVAAKVGPSPNSQLYVRKFLPNGDLDLSFGNGTTSFNPSSSLIRVTSIDANIEGFVIITGGTTGSQNFAIRFSPDGTLDTTFGNNGLVVLPSSGINTRCIAKLNNADEVIVSCSFPNNPSSDNDDFSFNSYLYKLLVNGVLDTTFNGTGQKFIEGYSINYLGNMIVQHNQRILFIGLGNFGFEGGLELNMLRFTSDGYLDSSFNFQNITGEYGGIDSLLHTNGSIMVAGSKIWYEYPINILLTNYSNSPLGIEEENTVSFSVVPNPSNGIFNIIHSSSLSPYYIYDLKGSLLVQGELKNQSTELDLSQFDSGIYLLKIKNSILKLVKK